MSDDLDVSSLERRVTIFLFTSAALGAGAAFYRWGAAVSGSFLLGAILGAINLFWLNRSAGKLLDKMVDPAPGGRGLVADFLLRLGLLAGFAFVIIQSSAVNVYAFLAGLVLPVFAFMMEAGYQIFLALKHGTDPNSQK